MSQTVILMRVVWCVVSGCFKSCLVFLVIVTPLRWNIRCIVRAELITRPISCMQRLAIPVCRAGIWHKRVIAGLLIDALFSTIALKFVKFSTSCYSVCEQHEPENAVTRMAVSRSSEVDNRTDNDYALQPFGICWIWLINLLLSLFTLTYQKRRNNIAKQHTTSNRHICICWWFDWYDGKNLFKNKVFSVILTTLGHSIILQQLRRCVINSCSIYHFAFGNFTITGTSLYEKHAC